VKFTPTTAGPVTDTLVIASSDPVSPSLSVLLTGTGVNTTPPQVTVTQPSSGQTVSSGAAFTVAFSVTSPTGAALTSYTVKLSTNGGASFSTLGSGIPFSGPNSFNATAPNVATANAQIQVSVTDANTNTGTGSSGFFTIGTPPVVAAYEYTPSGKMKVVDSGSTIQNGAVLVVVSSGGETFPLTFNGIKWIVSPGEIGSSGDAMKNVAGHGSSITVEVRNPSGLTSTPASATRQ